MRARVKLQSDIGSVVCTRRWRGQSYAGRCGIFGAVDQKLFHMLRARFAVAYGFWLSASGYCGGWTASVRQRSFEGFGLWFAYYDMLLYDLSDDTTGVNGYGREELMIPDDTFSAGIEARGRGRLSTRVKR